jgi:hypothetical protein
MQAVFDAVGVGDPEGVDEELAVAADIDGPVLG